MSAPVLSVENLTVTLPPARRPADGVSFTIHRGETVGLVGESGCGKSMTALALLQLLPPVAAITDGSVRLEGQDLVGLSESGLRALRGNRLAMIFQEPMTSLNPVLSCGEQIAEVLRQHRGLSRKDAAAKAVELLDRVQLSEPARRAGQVPHELSGGMRQRVMIAMAIACEPALLIADEPTTALDVTIQDEVLELLSELQRDVGMGLLHITHDLAVIGSTAQTLLVMYAGRIVESGPAAEVLSSPHHPYTLGLVACRPTLHEHRSRLPVIEGEVPDLDRLPTGCRFQTRCPFVKDRCRQEDPAATEVGPGRTVACFEVDAVRAAGKWPSHVVD